MSTRYQHSVSLEVDKCKGCTTCLKRCPTEAIRIRDGHAVIQSDRCIDCGECIRVCPYKAKKAIHDSLSCLSRFRYKVALPAPSLYGQFDRLDNIGYIIRGLKDLGFDDVFEVACAAELVSAYTRLYIKRSDVKKPVISSACPTITRMISMNYPDLCENLMPILPPVDIAAYLARQKAKEEHPELSDDDIGIIFISPCPAKVSYVKNDFSAEHNYVDAVVSVRDVYFALLDVMSKSDEEPTEGTESGIVGIGWASTGGESSAVFNDRYLAADGIENCIRVLDRLDQTEDADMEGLVFVELNACNGGCVGGAMTVANPYIAKAKLHTLKRYLPVSPNQPASEWIPDEFFFHNTVEYNPYIRLSEDRNEAFRMMSEIESIRECLPNIDCGSCGAPTCMAFAEDIVKGETTADECTVILKKMFHEYLEEHKDRALIEKLRPLQPQNDKNGATATDNGDKGGNACV